MVGRWVSFKGPFAYGRGKQTVPAGKVSVHWWDILPFLTDHIYIHYIHIYIHIHTLCNSDIHHIYDITYRIITYIHQITLYIIYICSSWSSIWRCTPIPYPSTTRHLPSDANERVESRKAGCDLGWIWSNLSSGALKDTINLLPMF